ncbi:plasmid stabilization protein [Erwinia typographi]|uniref:Toxin n=1 Tax=Erwinia typographi TaxID=371042 RepID=A0A0A3YTQ5_9GAMM|nr:type II toxin-antitoxin system RelE/ParE family toxin [Erwinia typographi]KGT88751.1 plasmid stabilization protein [Erwinia typographi]
MYKLTEIAVEDFAGIYDYTLQKFGEQQADHYTDELEAFFLLLADMPEMGRDYPAVPEIMRIDFQRHSIFYCIRASDILIIRILHQQMNHLRHFK